MNKFLLLTCGESSKKVPISGNLSVQYIRDSVKTKFGLDENFTLKYFDVDVLDYIDLDNDEDINTEERVVKIKVFTNKQSCRNDDQSNDLQDTPTCESQPPLPSMDSPSQMNRVQQQQTPTATTERTVSSPIQFRQDGPSSRPETPIQPPSPAIDKTPVDSCAKSTEKLSSRKPWPRIYQFPIATAPRALVLKLEEKEVLGKGDISRLLDTVYSDVSQYEGGLYPTADKYDQIVDGILRVLPQMIQESGLPLQSVRMYWREKLKYKWQNERKFKDKNLPEVVAKKRKPPVQQEYLNLPKEQVKLTWGMANFLPPPLDSEDDTSIGLHKQWLKDEFKKSSQNFSVVDLKMDLTFPSRRKAIVTENVETTALLQEYPFLKDRRQLFLEFKRLGPNAITKFLDEQFCDGLDVYFEAINSLCKGKKMAEFQKEVYEQIAVQHCSAERKYTRQCAAIIGISTLMKEKIEKVLCFGQEERQEESVLLVVKDKILTTNTDEFELYVDGTHIFSCDTFIELYTGFISAIYAFNLVYPKPLKKLCCLYRMFC